DEIETAALLKSLQGTRLYLPMVLAVTGGLRRGEILALRWQDVDLENGRAIVSRSLEETRAGVRVKAPKTERGRRTVVLPGFTLDPLRSHKAQQAERRLAAGPAYIDHDLICARDDGAPWSPDAFSTAFASFVRGCELPHFRFHDLRHTHATQLLRQGVHPK